MLTKAYLRALEMQVRRGDPYAGTTDAPPSITLPVTVVLALIAEVQRKNRKALKKT